MDSSRDSSAPDVATERIEGVYALSETVRTDTERETSVTGLEDAEWEEVVECCEAAER